MNYNQRIANAITEYTTHKMPYLSYFKREAKKAYKEDNEEFEDFFNSCKHIISTYKNDIENQFKNDLNKNNVALHSFKQMILSGQTIDENGRLIQEHIDYIENDKEYIMNLGYKTNSDYTCLITESGEITKNSFDSKHELNYSKIVEIENSILNLKNDLTSETNNTTHASNELKRNKLNIVLIDKIYNFCIETKVLDENIVSNVDFINTVESADFSIIYEHSKEQQSSTKMRYIIYVLNKFISINDWFLNAAHSIDTEPSKCSGVNVPTKWKNKANAIK